MKIEILFFLILLSFSVYAEEVEFYSYQGHYSSGEVFQGFVKFNERTLDDFEAGNVKIFLNNEETREGIYFYKVNDNEYFFYFDINDTGDYTVKLTNLQYKKEGRFVTVEKELNFFAEENNYSLNIKPGLFLNNEDIKINILNNKDEVFITFDAPEFVRHVYKQELIASNREREFVFNVDLDAVKKYALENGISDRVIFDIKILYGNKEYKVPIFYTVGSWDYIKFTNQFTGVKRSFYNDETLRGPLKFTNYLNKEVKDVRFEVEDSIKGLVEVNPFMIEKLNAFETGEIEIIVNKDKDYSKGLYKGNIILKHEELEINFPMELEVKEVVKEEPELVGKEEIKDVREEKKLYGGDFQEIGEVDDITKILNVSGTVPEDVERKSSGFVLFIFIMLAAVIVFYLFSRRNVKKEKFSEYIKKVKK